MVAICCEWVACYANAIFLLALRYIYIFRILANVIVTETVATAGYAAATADLEFLVVKRKVEAKSLANHRLGTETLVASNLHCQLVTHEPRFNANSSRN